MKNQAIRITTKTVAGIFLFVLFGLGQIIVCMNPANTFQYCGMAVDSQGRLFLGENLWIGIYENGVRVDEIVRNERYYEFTIIEDQIYLWGTSGNCKIYDLNGVPLQRGAEDYSLSKKERYEYNTADGLHYVMENHRHGRTKVVCYDPNGTETVVFRMPLIPYLVQFTMPLYFCVIVLWVSRSKWSAKWSIHALKKYWRPEKKDK